MFFFRLTHRTTELAAVDHYIPVKPLEVNAVQTRAASCRIAKDLVTMVAKGEDDQNYKELINLITAGVDFDELPDNHPPKSMPPDGKT